MRLRRPNIDGGTSGADDLASTATNTASSTAAGDEQADRRRGEPAVLDAAIDGVDDEDEAGRHRHRAGHVERGARRTDAGRHGQHEPGDEHDADGHVHEEHPLPAGSGGQRAAGDRADRGGRPGDGAEDAEGAVACGALRNVVVRIDRAAGETSAPPRPCTTRHATSMPSEPDSPAPSDATREDRHAGDEHRPATEEVGEAPAEQQEAAEREAVADDHPLQIGLAGAEVGLDRRQRDVHDRQVEDDHELGPAHQREDERGSGGSGSGRHGGCSVVRGGHHHDPGHDSNGSRSSRCRARARQRVTESEEGDELDEASGRPHDGERAAAVPGRQPQPRQHAGGAQPGAVEGPDVAPGRLGAGARRRGRRACRTARPRRRSRRAARTARARPGSTATSVVLPWSPVRPRDGPEHIGARRDRRPTHPTRRAIARLRSTP